MRGTVLLFDRRVGPDIRQKYRIKKRELRINLIKTHINIIFISLVIINVLKKFCINLLMENIEENIDLEIPEQESNEKLSSYF